MLKVESAHQDRRRDVVDGPEGTYHARHAGLKETGGEADRLVGDLVEVDDPRLAGREDRQPGGRDVEAAVQEVAQRQLIGAREGQGRVERLPDIERAVAGE